MWLEMDNVCVFRMIAGGLDRFGMNLSQECARIDSCSNVSIAGDGVAGKCAQGNRPTSWAVDEFV